MEKQDALDLIDALRSGKFTQTTHALGKMEFGSDGYAERNCCLGVLCRIKGLQGKRENHFVTYDGHGDYAPPALGLKDREGNLGHIGDNYFTLAQLNDEGYTFEEIADVLYWFVESGLISRV